MTSGKLTYTVSEWVYQYEKKMRSSRCLRRKLLLLVWESIIIGKKSVKKHNHNFKRTNQYLEINHQHSCSHASRLHTKSSLIYVYTRFLSIFFCLRWRLLFNRESLSFHPISPRVFIYSISPIVMFVLCLMCWLGFDGYMLIIDIYVCIYTHICRTTVLLL